MSTDTEVIPVIEAEKIVIGTLMTDPVAVKEVAPRLTAGQFYHPRHGTIYRHLLAAHAAGEPVEPIALAHRLDAAGDLARVGGAPYLLELVEAVPLAAHVDYYVAKVLNAANQRAIAERGTRLVKAAAITDPDRRDQVVADVVESLTGAANWRHEQKTVNAVEALLSRMLDRDALDKIPPPKPLIQDVLDLDSESWIIGAPGGFKSFVALDWACHIATGQEWRGKRVTQGRVVYVAAEGQKSIPLRVKAWEAMYGRRAENVLFLPEPVQVADAAGWQVLVEACRRLEPVLIVVDTQARITVGLDENSNGAMSVLTEAVRKLKAATGACVLVVHHIGRNGGDARGASAIDGAQDTEIRVERPEGTVKRRNLTAVISTDKQKDGDESARFEVQLQVMDLGIDPETGRPLSSLALKPHDPSAEIVREQPDWLANLTENQVEVMAALRDHSDESGATRSQAIGWVNARCAEHDRPAMKSTSYDSAVKALVSKRLVTRLPGSRIAVAEYLEDAA